MSYMRGKQVMVWIDQNNQHAWITNLTSNWQWTPSVVTHYSDTPPSVTCLVASPPYLKPPTFTSSWQTTKKFDMINVRPIETDLGACMDL
eukprot:4821807-Ditylum_brightwellii.AAC.1